MMRIAFIMAVIFFISSCSIRDRESNLKKKLVEINEREQKLILREKSLQLQEEALLIKEKKIDSTSRLQVDSLSRLYPDVVGSWTATMNCVSSSCAGSAIGDVIVQNWDISFQSNRVIAKVMSGNNIIRLYAGTYAGNALELTAQQNNSTDELSPKITVRVITTKPTEMTGQREITRNDGCRIMYAIELKKPLPKPQIRPFN